MEIRFSNVREVFRPDAEAGIRHDNTRMMRIAFFGRKRYRISCMAGLEGVMKIVLFLTYVTVISYMKDVRRVFQYHGAEHKTIHCFEAGEALTVENVRKHSRLHPRCGTSFILFVLVISIMIFYIENVI